jgi:hypothetical protein
MYDKVFNQLSHLRQVGQDRWRARCPAHDSDGPSLALAIADDDRLLIKCHAGCGALDVLHALGCSWEDCFPEMHKRHRSLAREFDIRPAGTIDDRIVDLAQHSANLTEKQVAEAEAAALRGGRPDGFCKEVASNLPENKQWAEQLLECERELIRAEMALSDDMRRLATKCPVNETDEHRAAIAAWEAHGK